MLVTSDTLIADMAFLFKRFLKHRKLPKVPTFRLPAYRFCQCCTLNWNTIPRSCKRNKKNGWTKENELWTSKRDQTCTRVTWWMLEHHLEYPALKQMGKLFAWCRDVPWKGLTIPVLNATDLSSGLVPPDDSTPSFSLCVGSDLLIASVALPLGAPLRCGS